MLGLSPNDDNDGDSHDPDDRSGGDDDKHVTPDHGHLAGRRRPGQGPLLWVELYFKYIHDQLHSLFHRPSFMLDLHGGTAPLVLVYGMMALSARFSSNHAFSGIPPMARGEHFATERASCWAP
ncbi:putative transcriptional regulatory protein like [Verticillium longisporum]|uniref:Putative transcriptional regulatory protein like n=1 Tax=Verticillium longisporum TaxID=100787 RepID=A0A8I2ZYC0_VERLO|nr:putative transcriptional regulatory protein like [Verticillium longisporum]